MSCRDAKVVVFGDTGVGKSSLIRRMYGESPLSVSSRPSVRTEVVDFLDMEIDGNRFSLWDFGGADMYRPAQTHFLSDGAISLVLFSLTSPDDLSRDRCASWISFVLSRAKGVRFILVGTYCGSVSESARDTKLARVYDEMRERFGSCVCEGVCADSLLDLGVGDVKVALVDVLLSKVRVGV